MSKDKKSNIKLDVRTIFDSPLSDQIIEECEKSTRKYCQLVRHVMKEHFKNKATKP